MKKISLLFITAVMIISLCACGRESSKPAATATDLTDEQLQALIEEIQREQEAQAEKG